MLVQMAHITSQAEKPPQVLLIIAARFQRMQQKYQSVTYSVTLKNVGALYQTMYLVGTAMGLAPCGLGGGNSDLFTKAAGIDYLEETSVGEFMLGTRATTPNAPKLYRAAFK
jgi:SagB-type dehydrogenase family enzyme